MAANDPAAHRLLPQNSNPQLSSFTFASSAYQQPREVQKNYVFVDEHNRHKRLKVMRACEGCRRRKIKCDAATTNTWPCSACVRLKLHCVRPNGYEGAAEAQVYEPPQINQVDDSFRPQQHALYHQPDPQQHAQLMAAVTVGSKPSSIYPSHTGYAESAGIYGHVPQYADFQVLGNSIQFTGVPPVNVVDYAPQHAFPTPPQQPPSQERSESPPGRYRADSFAQQDLAALLGSLKVDEAGTAPYLRKKSRGNLREEESVVEEQDDYKSLLPPLTAGPGSRIRIPPELMPDDATILNYFELYFANTHPYVPVLDRAQFLHQWQANRDSVSPLLIEAIFAIGGRLADDPGDGQQWLALATRHADSFMDVPRLSTLQALLIILKAREQAPKKGYYYRSWMNIVHCVHMARDLGLDDHYDDHKAGHPCDDSPAECQLKTRIWQTIFVCEVMIGAAQGRTDLQVTIESVDFDVPQQVPGVDQTEHQISRNFTYIARIVRNIGRMSHVYARLRRQKEWGLDPEFVEISAGLDAWLAELPPDLVVSFPADGSAPWIPSAFVGNMHTHYYLSVIIFHRPQLAFVQSGPGAAASGQWKQHMVLSYEAAKNICRLQEAVMGTYGLPGLQGMQRGINFTIYAVLACIVLHLVVLTSPEPDRCHDARGFFERHMRILERCMGAWPMPDMQRQVDSLREAFSADLRKPFALKPGFPGRSPSLSTLSSPAGSAMLTTPTSTHSGGGGGNGGYRGVLGARTLSTNQINMQQLHHMGYASHPITPPVSAEPLDAKGDDHSPHMPQSIALMGVSGLARSQGGGFPEPDPSAWNPSRIFDQWNDTFGTPTPPPAPQSSSSSSSAPGASIMPLTHGIGDDHGQYHHHHHHHHNYHTTMPMSCSSLAVAVAAAPAAAAPTAAAAVGHPQAPALSLPSPPPGASEVPTVHDIQAVHAELPPGAAVHHLIPPAPPPMQQPSSSSSPPSQFSAAAPPPNFVTPAMWQESVASAFASSMKRSWDGL